MKIPIIDAVITYDCPDTTKVWLLTVYNVLFVESMNHNLIPPFILREDDMEVNDRAKIHNPQGKPSLTDHTYGSSKHVLLIPFKHSEIFSMLDSRRPTNDDFFDGTPVAITPGGEEWDPNPSQFEHNENTYTDVQEQMILKKHVNAVLIDDDDFMEDEWK